MGAESGSGGSIEQLSAAFGALATGESAGATKARAFLAAVFDKVVTTPSLKAQLVEALTALKDTTDDVWKDVPPMQRLAASGTLKMILKGLDK